MDRRAFCRSAATGIGLTALAGPSLAASWREPGAPAILAVIYDERYADAREFAWPLRRRGAVAFPIRGDSSSAWYGELGVLLRQRQGRVAGMSSDADLFIARSCGRELGLCPLVEAAHDARGSEDVAHRFRVAAGTGMFRGPRCMAGPSPGKLADIYSRIADEPVPRWHELEASGPRRADHPGYLTSWLLGPRVRAQERIDRSSTVENIHGPWAVADGHCGQWQAAVSVRRESA